MGNQKRREKNSDIVAEIYCYKAGDENNGQELLDSFDVICDYDEVKTSFFELEKLTDPELVSFRNQGYSIRKAKELCDPTDKVLIRMHNHNVTNLIKKLFPGKKVAKFLGE